MKTAQHRRSTTTVRDIVATLLPSYPELEGRDRQVVERAVSDYVAAQIDAMPSFLRLPYRLALLAFEVMPAPRYGRPFGRLRPALRESYLASWSRAPVPPMRDFVKLIRSTALLVFFDHPLVRARLEQERSSNATPDQLAERG